MTIVDFDCLKMTTMTAIIDLEGTVDIESAFPLLPITKLEIPDLPRTNKKYKIPWPGKEHAGKIFSIKYQTMSRGISKTLSNKAFRNSISLDICTSEKNIAAKLSANNIHMCGPNSEELAYETANLLIQHLKDIQTELDYINLHLKERDLIVRWLMEESKGTKYLINEETQEIITLEPGQTVRHGTVYENGKQKMTFKEYPFKWEDGDHVDKNGILVNKHREPYYRQLNKEEKKAGKKEFPVIRKDEIRLETDSIPVDSKGKKIIKIAKIPLRVMDVHSIRIPPSIKIEDGKMTFPKHLDGRICKFLIRYIGDYAYHHVLVGFLNNFKDISRVYIPPILKESFGSSTSSSASGSVVPSTNDVSSVPSVPESNEINETDDVVIPVQNSPIRVIGSVSLPPIIISSNAATSGNITTEKEKTEANTQKEKEKEKVKYGEFKAGKINIAMANYSYSLNMKVDRWQLCQLVDGYNGFSARYNNTTDHHVAVTLPYTPEEGESIKRKAIEKCHTFMVYKTGIVTQSGPHPKLMKDVYLEFMNFIESVRDKIRIEDDRPFNVKFKPSTSL